MACVACHEDAWTRPHAGLPGITICAGCHQEPLGDHPEEDKLTSYVMSRKEIPFVQVNRYPGHVYFSHRAHVALGEMDCATCHAEVPTMTLPHARPAASRHSMEDCMACHRQAGATLECLACHK